tara:strand:- start:159 stop:293 length:135 start_codon:yes stop_codon:yes gene_type:complete
MDYKPINNPIEKKTNPKIHLDFFFEYSISGFFGVCGSRKRKPVA